jgi:hypothetical protein
VKRLKWRRFMRNVCVALGNAGDSGDLEGLRRLEACGDGLVAEHARWAIARIKARAPLVLPAAASNRPEPARWNATEAG